MELELRSVERQGDHKARGRAQGAGTPPTLVERVWPPWSSYLARIFYCFF